MKTQICLITLAALAAVAAIGAPRKPLPLPSPTKRVDWPYRIDGVVVHGTNWILISKETRATLTIHVSPDVKIIQEPK